MAKTIKMGKNMCPELRKYFIISFKSFTEI